MTKNTVNEKERMVITRVFDAPRALVWKAWTDPQYVMQWWGPKGFTAPFCKIDFRVGGKFLCCMKSPDGQEGWNGGEYHEIVPHEKIVYSLYFADSKGNKVEPAQYGIEHEAIDDARDVVIFEDFGNGQTKHGRRKEQRATRGLESDPRKSCRSYCGASEGEIRSWSFDDRPARDTAKAGGGGLVRTGFSSLGRIVTFPAK